MPPYIARPITEARLVSPSGILAAHGAQLPSRMNLCKPPRRLGHQLEADVPLFLIQARATPESLQSGTERLAPSTLSPKPVLIKTTKKEKKKRQQCISRR